MDRGERSFAWLGHAAVRIETGSTVVYVDPFELRPEKSPTADLVLVTNPRLGHWSPEDVGVVRRKGTRVAGPPEVARAYGASGRALVPGDELEVGDVRVRAVPAHNVGRSFFPADAGWLGYLLDTPGSIYYHAGATDRLPLMERLRADVVFLPVCGRYVMDADTAREVAQATGAAVRVGTYVAGERYREVPGFTV